MKFVLLISIFSWAISCDQRLDRKEIGPPVLPDRKLNAAFLIVDGVFNSELIAPMDVLQHTQFHTDKGIEVFTIAETKNPLKTFEGLNIIPDYAFTNDSIPSIDILIVPSARNSMTTDLENDQLLKFVNSEGRRAQYVMSLCDGAFILAKAQLLDLHECTTFPGDVEKFEKAFPQLKVHRNVSFVADRTIITSAGGSKSYDAALYLVELLYGKEVAQKIATGLVIDWELNKVKHLVAN